MTYPFFLYLDKVIAESGVFADNRKFTRVFVVRMRKIHYSWQQVRCNKIRDFENDVQDWCGDGGQSYNFRQQVHVIIPIKQGMHVINVIIKSNNDGVWDALWERTPLFLFFYELFLC